MKKRVSIFECKEGDIVAKDILNNNGVIIVAESTTMNPYILGKLIEFGIWEVYILEPRRGSDNMENVNQDLEEFSEDYWDSVFKMKDIITDLSSGKRLDIEKIDQITKGINEKVSQASEIVQCLKMIRSADEYTYTHCINTAFYAMLISKWLKLSDQEIYEVIQSGLLHDIGKAKIPKDILNKKGPLSKEEFEIIKKHTLLGYEMIHGFIELGFEVKKAVLSHHERMDCSGYPFNASPNVIGLYAKIVAVADVFDAMTSNRVYKRRSTPFDVFEMFKTVGVGIYDLTVMNTFIRNISIHFVGTRVELSNGDTGKIVYVPPQDIENPIVITDGKYIDLSQADCKIVSIL